MGDFSSGGFAPLLSDEKNGLIHKHELIEMI